MLNITCREAASIYLLIYLVTFIKHSSALETNTCYKFHTDDQNSKNSLLANIFLFPQLQCHIFHRMKEMVRLSTELTQIC